MSRTFRRLAALFSVALNIVFLGASLLSAMPRWIGANQIPGGALPYQALHLTAEQMRQFEPARHAFHARMQAEGETIRAEQLRLVDLLAQPEPDRSAIRATQERIQDLQRKMQETVIEHLLQEKTVFTGEQQTQFFRLIRERIAQHALAGPLWMQHGAGGPSGRSAP